MSESCDSHADVHRRTIVKARKQHFCSACQADIMPGDYYASVFVVGDGDQWSFKRCGSCETTWQHLKRLCDEYNAQHANRGDNLYPMEDLSCGKDYEEEWGDLPEEIAALPMLSAAERGALLKPVTKEKTT